MASTSHSNDMDEDLLRIVNSRQTDSDSDPEESSSEDDAHSSHRNSTSEANILDIQLFEGPSTSEEPTQVEKIIPRHLQALDRGLEQINTLENMLRVIKFNERRDPLKQVHKSLNVSITLKLPFCIRDLASEFYEALHEERKTISTRYKSLIEEQIKKTKNTLSFIKTELAEKLTTKPDLAKVTEKKILKIVKKRKAGTREPNKNFSSTSKRSKYN